MDAVFDRLRSQMPVCLAGDFDHAQHRTVADLAWMAQHELDMIEENEHHRPAREVSAIRKYLAKCRATLAPELPRDLFYVANGGGTSKTLHIARVDEGTRRPLCGVTQSTGNGFVPVEDTAGKRVCSKCEAEKTT